MIDDCGASGDGSSSETATPEQAQRSVHTEFPTMNFRQQRPSLFHKNWIVCVTSSLIRAVNDMASKTFSVLKLIRYWCQSPLRVSSDDRRNLPEGVLDLLGPHFCALICGSDKVKRQPCKVWFNIHMSSFSSAFNV